MKTPLWKQPGLGRLVVMTVASAAFFAVQIVIAHVTHSLTLLAAAYHMLYNILSLTGCITTIKVIDYSLLLLYFRLIASYVPRICEEECQNDG